MQGFRPATRLWFERAFPAATAVQTRGWERISNGEHALLLAPTGSGKTLAAFLWCLDRLQSLPADAKPGVRVLYVSPLKALVYDVERNLRAPLAGLRTTAEQLGETPRSVRVDIRTGDTPARDRVRQAKDPAEILVTTPESLFLLLGTAARETLRTVETVIVDEIHAVAGTKRGVHLALSLERLSELCDRDPQRVGLSATQRPLSEIASFLGGDRPVAIVDTAAPPQIDLQIVVPVADMTKPVDPPAPLPASGPLLGLGKEPPRRALDGMWPAIHPKILALIREHRSTIVFVNSRLLCERLAQALNELAGEDLVRAHHGSIARERRVETEEMLKSGALPAIVATSSLELGIDMGAVDLVIQVESPGSVARGLQRVGRARHQVGGTPKGRIFPKHRGDLLEAAVVAEHMRVADIESTRVPRNCLDVLSQQVVAMVAVQDRKVDALLSLVRRSYPYRDLSPEALASVLDMLSGRYPSEQFGELRPRIVWDRDTDMLRARKGAGLLALVNAGTIPDRGLYAVHYGEKGPRIGELDEEMVFESRKGQNVILGASTWRIEEITRDRVIVSPAPGQPGTMPFWKGDGPGRPIELGRALGRFVREVTEGPDGANRPVEPAHEAQPEGMEIRESAVRVAVARDAAIHRLEAVGLDEWAAKNLIEYLDEQREVSALPTDRTIVVERFRDELGDWRICILTPFGARIHAPWALVLEAAIGQQAGFELQAMWSDDGIVLRFADADELPGQDALFPDPEAIEDLLIGQLSHSAVFAGRFRENAGRALLLPRRQPGRRQPLWAQRLKSQNLLAVALQFPSFPIVLETYRECLRDVFDVPGLVSVLSDVRSRALRVRDVETRAASPFAKSLAFQWVANFLYDGDAPLAERRAQALTLDRDLLRDLLGETGLRELLDADAVAEVEAELGCTAPHRRARDADQLHDLLRRLGDLTEAEIAARCSDEPFPANRPDPDADDLPPATGVLTERMRGWLDDLDRARRALRLRIGGEERWIAVEDTARYRDALGVVPPGGVPAVFLESVEKPLEDLLLRWARTHGPFHTRELTARYLLPPGMLEPTLKALVASGRLVFGEIRPGGTGPEWCDAEVLRRLRRASLARMRKQIAAVDAPVLARFLVRWHGIGQRYGGHTRLREVVAQLEGLALPWSELEKRILPSRVPDFRPSMLDELGAMGEIAWIGRDPLRGSDGKILLFRRDRVPLLVDPPVAPDDLTPAAARVLAHLQRRGACFLTELATAAQAPLDEAVEAVWDLVWAGLVTNDTFQPLRELGRVGKGRREAAKIAGGRWSLVADLVGEGSDLTRRLHARATNLLERHGVVSSAVATAEEVPGGFSSLSHVYRAMEEQGKARRGWFVDGLGGAQFAIPGAIDRLRAAADEAPEAVVLSALDPANPWGATLPWPASEGRPRRTTGASVVLFGGVPALFLDKGAHSGVVFPALAEEGALAAVLEALRRSMDVDRKRSLRIDRLDGADSMDHAIAARLLAAGAVQDNRAITVTRD